MGEDKLEASSMNPGFSHDDFIAQEKLRAQETGRSLGDHSAEVVRSKRRESEFAQEHIENYKKKIEALRTEIDAKRSSLITRIFDYRKIKELRQDLGRTENILAQREDEQGRRQELIGQFDAIVDSETRLGQLMDEAYEENKAFDALKQQEFKEDEQKRSLESLVKKHQVFFVSDIVDADWKPSENNQAVDTKKLNFDDQLNIILGLDPTIAVSTLSPDSKNRTFGKQSWGVLLSAGRVVGGSETDAASVVTGLRSRYIDKNQRSTAAIDKAIERPLGNGKIESESYNELVVERPEVAGVYFKWGRDWPEVREGETISLQNGKNASYDGWWEQIASVMQTGAPIFMIEPGNNVRLVYDINSKARSFKVTPKYDPENLTDMPGVYKSHTTADSKKSAVTKVIDKVGHLLPENERSAYGQASDQSDSRSPYNVY